MIRRNELLEDTDVNLKIKARSSVRQLKRVITNRFVTDEKVEKRMQKFKDFWMKRMIAVIEVEKIQTLLCEHRSHLIVLFEEIMLE